MILEVPSNPHHSVSWLPLPCSCPVQAGERQLPPSPLLCPLLLLPTQDVPAWLLRYLQKAPPDYPSPFPTFSCQVGCVNWEWVQRASSGPTPVLEQRISPAPVTSLIQALNLIMTACLALHYVLHDYSALCNL